MKPIHGSYVYKALHDENSMVMACNTRIVKGVASGILKAAKDADSAIIFELAKSECDVKPGYTGFTPEKFSKMLQKVADEVKHDVWVLHGDHIKTTPDTMDEVKELITLQIKNGYTSFAIDASHLYDMKAKTVKGALQENIDCTIEIAKFIASKYGSDKFGLECEVGEVGKKNKEGLVLTTPEEATTYITALRDAGVDPHLLAIANGSSHGNIYDSQGNPIAQVTIDIKQTKNVADALEKAGLNVRIAQHGITGTPLEFIASKFPHGSLEKGNVGTFWMNLVWDVFKVYEPELYKEIFDWTMKNYKDEAMKKGMKKDEQIFGLYGKKAIGEFFDKIYNVSKETEKAIEAQAYASAMMFFKAFNSFGTAKIVRDFMKGE